MTEALIALPIVALTYAALTWLYPPLLRPLLWLVAHTFYRFRVINRDRIPATGGLLIVCNHVSYIDWLFLWLACPRRTTFVLWNTYDRHRVLRFILSWGRRNVLRIDDRTDHPHAIVASLKRVTQSLDSGEAVVIFPEGRLTRSGNMLPFHRGIERILRETTTDIRVVPTATSGLWGSFFSYGGGPILRKLPRFRPRVAVWFGEPMNKYGANLPLASNPSPPCLGGKGVGGLAERTGVGCSIISAGDLRLAVQEATADLAIRESDHIQLVHRAFVHNATKFRNLFRPCIIDNATGAPRTLTGAKTLVAALCVTNYLRSRVGDAPCVGVWLPTSLGGALANLAIAFLGKTSVNLNYTAGKDAVNSAIRQAGIRTIISSKRFVMRATLDAPDGTHVIYLEDVLDAVTKWQRIRTFLAVLLLPGFAIDRWLGLHRHKLDDALTLVFSSGSTGEPKGIILTHRNVGHNAISSVRTIGIEPSDRLFGILPFFHSFGYTVCLWAPLVANCTAVLYPDPRSAKEVGELSKKHRVTLMLSTATFLRFYIRRCNADDFSTLRMLICGAEKLPVKLQDQFKEKFGFFPLEGYGCTELAPVVSTNLPDIAMSGVVQERNHRGTVGQPIFGVCVKTFTTNEAHAPLPVGEEGVLCAKGPNVMAGYLNQPEKTADAIRDGWYNTGDVGHIEPDGFIRITGRVSRFAKIAGEMVPLERLDEELHDVLGSTGERVLAVAAVPDEKRGERVVVLHLVEVCERLTAALDVLATRGLPNLWVPDRRDCHAVESMPVLGSGKLDLKKLGDLAKELAK